MKNSKSTVHFSVNRMGRSPNVNRGGWGVVGWAWWDQIGDTTRKQGQSETWPLPGVQSTRVSSNVIFETFVFFCVLM